MGHSAVFCGEPAPDVTHGELLFRDGGHLPVRKEVQDPTHGPVSPAVEPGRIPEKGHERLGKTLLPFCEEPRPLGRILSGTPPGLLGDLPEEERFLLRGGQMPDRLCDAHGQREYRSRSSGTSKVQRYS